MIIQIRERKLRSKKQIISNMKIIWELSTHIFKAITISPDNQHNNIILIIHHLKDSQHKSTINTNNRQITNIFLQRMTITLLNNNLLRISLPTNLWFQHTEMLISYINLPIDQDMKIIHQKIIIILLSNKLNSIQDKKI